MMYPHNSGSTLRIFFLVFHSKGEQGIHQNYINGSPPKKKSNKWTILGQQNDTWFQLWATLRIFYKSFHNQKRPRSISKLCLLIVFSSTRSSMNCFEGSPWSFHQLREREVEKFVHHYLKSWGAVRYGETQRGTACYRGYLDTLKPIST